MIFLFWQLLGTCDSKTFWTDIKIINCVISLLSISQTIGLICDLFYSLIYAFNATNFPLSTVFTVSHKF